MGVGNRVFDGKWQLERGVFAAVFSGRPAVEHLPHFTDPEDAVGRQFYV